MVLNRHVDSVTVLPLGGEAAVAFFRYVWVFGSQPDLPVRGAMTLVYVRTPSGWRVAHDHTSSLPPNTPMTADAAALAEGPAQPVRETIPCELTRIVDGDTIECRRVEGHLTVVLEILGEIDRGHPAFA